MKRRKESFMLGSILQKIAPEIGATVLLEPEWGIAGAITFKSGARSYFRYNTLDLNPMGASDIARDKDYADFFMKSLGYPTIPGSKTFFSDAWADTIHAPHRTIDAGYQHALSIGFPVMVKPNSGSQGKNVSLVHTKRELYRALRRIFKHDRVAIVQKPVTGTDYRLVVLDDEVLSAYTRIPLNIVGDGIATVETLIQKKQRDFKRAGRDTIINSTDERIVAKLKRQKLDFSSVPDKGAVIYLLDNANLSTGGDSIDVTKTLHPLFKKLAIAITRDMGLRLCGVDLMVEGDISDAPQRYWILEINSAPGLDHYAKMGSEQAHIVESLYLKVLKHLER